MLIVALDLCSTVVSFVYQELFQDVHVRVVACACAALTLVLTSLGISATAFLLLAHQVAN
jgi:hypothetical protein